MKNIIFLLILILSSNVNFAQTFDEKKAYVKEKYKEIENSSFFYTQKSYVDQPYEDYPPVGYYDYWINSENEVVKAVWQFGEEGYHDENNYYFDNGKLFFVYSVYCEPNWSNEKFAQD